MPRRDRALTRRVLLQGAGALAGAAAAFSSTPAQASRPDLILLCPLSYPLSPQAEGFTFSNFHGDYPFWAPSWTEVLSGRPLGRAVMPERHSLATAFAASGYEPVLVAGDAAANSCAGLGFASAVAGAEYPRESGRPLLLVVLGEVEFDAAAFVSADSILVWLPRLAPIAGRRRPTPLMIRSRAGAGDSDVPINPLDIAPTVCGLAGVPRSPVFVGRDYSALVT